jgi:hypothetical protein
VPTGESGTIDLWFLFQDGCPWILGQDGLPALARLFFSFRRQTDQRRIRSHPRRIRWQTERHFFINGDFAAIRMILWPTIAMSKFVPKYERLGDAYPFQASIIENPD